jgi:hypothetical protein
LVKRLVAQELKLSFVPDVEQRLWRTVMRRKHQLTRNRVQFQNRLECLLEEAHIKLSSLVLALVLLLEIDGGREACVRPNGLWLAERPRFSAVRSSHLLAARAIAT